MSRKALLREALCWSGRSTPPRKQNLNIDRFLKIVHKYTDITEVSAEIVRDFIGKIIVYKAEKVNGVRTQRIQIIYNCIGAVDFQKQNEKTA